MEQERRSIVGVHTDRELVRKRSQIFARPHVMDPEPTTAETRDVGEFERLRGGSVGVDDEYVSSLRRPARVKLRRRSSGGRRCCVEWCGWSTDYGVLVEREQFSVLDDIQLRRIEVVKL